MIPVLLRMDGSGEALILDGIVGYRGAPGVLVAQHPVQALGVVVDHAQRLATGFVLEWICTMTPTVAGVQTGPDRLTQVLGWLDQAIGAPLTLSQPNLPPNDQLFLSGYTYEQRGRLALSITLSFIRAQVAVTRTIDPTEGATTPPGRSARGDSAAGRAPTQDRGPQPTKRKSILAAGADALAGFLGVD